MALAIAMIVAYLPFLWYFIDSALKKRAESESDKRQKKYPRKDNDGWGQ